VRVLIATVPAAGHVNPLVPLALRLQALGDEVVWATGPDMTERLATQGLRAVPVGPPLPTWFERLRARTRGQPGDGVPAERRAHWFVPRLFGEVGAALMVDDLLALARDVMPDVIVYESRCYAAAAVAKATGTVPVLRAVTSLLPAEVETLAGDAVTPLWRELGLDPPILAGMFDGLVLSEWPASLDDPSGYPGLVVDRLAPSPVETPPPDWLGSWVSKQAGRPIVYATVGTASSAVGPLALLLDALGVEDVAVLMTIGDAVDPDALGIPPPNVRLERYVPQDAVLPHCAGVVSHGGSGTTLGALAHGLPQVVVPQGADQFINATLVDKAGAGRGLSAEHLDPDTVRDAVREVLTDQRYAARAQHLRSEMLAATPANEAIALIRDRVPTAP
jgi:UDP:flavonoid glycosyltransferase YjiC (YdhE family)